MKVVYPALFHEDDGGWWVEFPDLPGCTTQGDTELEAYCNAAEAMELYLQDDYEVCTLPVPSATEKVAHDGADFVSLVCGNFDVPQKSIKKTLTILAWLNSKAERAGVNFSHVLQDALKKLLDVQDPVVSA
ncbi:MAG: type II toxin-antitoxin system HicB family antitoxin [Treponema sp.]|nr:type II toxin-antitoxin system HicB family antitoxin [Treponema sp.]MBD5448502.1 type II toxin-antitoxin system HicB family antitoxin [Treponema sp.]